MASYDKNVFINCPFDNDYKNIFNAILFTVVRCEFVLRWVSLSKTNELPRFNMPLELGICIGAINFGWGNSNWKQTYFGYR